MDTDDIKRDTQRKIETGDIRVKQRSSKYHTKDIKEKHKQPTRGFRRHEKENYIIHQREIQSTEYIREGHRGIKI